MDKIVLCIDNKNLHLEETKKYLGLHGCKVYTLYKEEKDMEALCEKIEQEEGKIDLLLMGIDEQIPQDGAIGEKHDCERLLEVLSQQINRAQEAIEAALPLLRRGDLKRIGMLTKKDSSIGRCREDSDYGRHMAWAGLNMLGKLYFNQLRPEGFTFRWYCTEEERGGMSAGEYLLSGFCYDAGEPYQHSDENRFVMRDAHLKEIVW